MGWNNPPVSWRELERALVGEPVPDGGDGPAWARKRPRYRNKQDISFSDGELTQENIVPYAELHCHSNFSFLDGASHPEELIEEAARLQLSAIAITDHDGMYGVARFAEAAQELNVRTVFGAELTLGLTELQSGAPDPAGDHLVVLAKNQHGYANLCRAITNAQLHGYQKDLPRNEEAVKGKPVYDLAAVAEEVFDSCVVLTSCRKGAVRRALYTKGLSAARQELRKLSKLFGHSNVFVELIDHGQPENSTHNDSLATLADELSLPVIATNAVHYATPQRYHLASAMSAIRARRDIEELQGWLPPNDLAYLRSGREMSRRFSRYPGAVERAAELGLDCAFSLELIAPKLPDYDVPAGHTEATFLREKVYVGMRRYYGDGEKEEEAKQQISHELAIIEKLGFPGYFLIVWDIVEFCRSNNILCQGRGSAANSAVCYALGITKIDAVRWELLFERFLAPDRDGYPDIDLDIESDRREEVIQYVYRKYGRLCAAQVANVITYRSRSAVRDAARALGYTPGQQDAWSKQIDRWGPLNSTKDDHDHNIPLSVLELAVSLEDFPRHLGIHPGGMVICDRPVSEVCPIEWGRMANRSVVQWDKDDCASVGLVKFDLLGLGMLSALHYMIDLVEEYEGKTVDIARLDLADKNIYDMLCKADAIGVFQVESRAQLATLPRLRPQKFYDLAIEVALIRPGPIQGGSVHPFIRRYTKKEKWEHDHPLLKKALHRTCGVPIFQEQMMQIAVDVANFTAAEADELRHAMGAKRSTEKMERLRERFYQGAASNGIDEELITRIFTKMQAFASFGFPESHALSFALLVFSSAYFKRYHPAAFCAALLRAQPMGFYSPQSLIADARRHGITVHGPDINRSLSHATLERASPQAELSVRIGIFAVRSIGMELAETIVQERKSKGNFASIAELARRVSLKKSQLEALATAGAFDSLAGERRKALWVAGTMAQENSALLPGTVVGTQAPVLPGMENIELAIADEWATGVTPGSFPTQFIRDYLTGLGVIPAAELKHREAGSHVIIGGAVTHRQRPATAGGITFLNIEDETGMVNVVCFSTVWRQYHRIARNSPALLIYGVVENVDGVVSVRANHLRHLSLRIPGKSRDFR